MNEIKKGSKVSFRGMVAIIKAVNIRVGAEPTYDLDLTSKGLGIVPGVRQDELDTVKQ